MTQQTPTSLHPILRKALAVFAALYALWPTAAWSQEAPLATTVPAAATGTSYTLRIFNGTSIPAGATASLHQRCDVPQRTSPTTFTISGPCVAIATAVGAGNFKIEPTFPSVVATSQATGSPSVSGTTITVTYSAAVAPTPTAAEIVVDGTLSPTTDTDTVPHATLTGHAYSALYAARTRNRWSELVLSSAGGGPATPLRYEVVEPAPATTTTRRETATDAVHPSCAASPTWCERLQRQDPDAYFVCVDTVRGFDHFFLYPEGLPASRGLMLPNRRVVVAARYPAGGDAPRAQIDPGQIGSEEASIRTPTATQPSTAVVNAGGGSPATCVSSHVYSVPSLRSGTATLAITTAGSSTPTNLTFVVERVYAGAIRFGLSSVFGPAVSHQYNVVTSPGSSQREIGVTFSGAAEFELVVGASAFVWDLALAPSEGRTYVSSRPWYSYVLPAPFVGLGVVGTLGQKVTAFQSLHIGGEWEFTRSFSIAVTGVLRRTTRLNSGLVIGSPVTDESVDASTHAELNWGLGLVVNFSPEILQVATPTIAGR